jgi:hypothetical protein
MVGLCFHLDDSESALRGDYSQTPEFCTVRAHPRGDKRVADVTQSRSIRQAAPRAKPFEYQHNFESLEAACAVRRAVPVETPTRTNTREHLGAASLAVVVVVTLWTLAACGDDVGLGEQTALGSRGDAGDSSHSQGSNASGPWTADSSDGGRIASPAERAQAAFDGLSSDLDTACGNCHATGVGGAPTFLAKPDVYASIAKYKGIVVKDYTNSRLLVVGPATGHSGGLGVEGALRTSATAWLKLEADALTLVPIATTHAFTIAVGPNSIDISNSSANVLGAKMNFTVSILGTTLILTNLQVSAPAASGVHIRGPRFVVVSDERETEDSVDSLSHVDQTVGAGQTATLGPGTLLLHGFAQGNRLRVRFARLVPATAVTLDAGAGGCKSDTTFRSSASPQLQNLCVACHGGNNVAATGAMDLRLLASDPPKACAQALTKVNTANKAQSPLLLRPRAASGHPEVNGFNQETHDVAMLGWINNE